MKEFEKATLEIITYIKEDVITVSGESESSGPFDDGYMD